MFVWERELGRAYRWGGDNPLVGFDCSGLVLEGLKAAGLFPRKGDDTAAGLSKKFPEPAAGLRPGCLLFWTWGGTAIVHVEIVWEVSGSKVWTIGAAGGGSTTIDEAAAIAADAYVMIRPARAGWVRAVDPFWE